MLLLFILACGLYHSWTKTTEAFVPFNATEAVDELKPDQWRGVKAKFGTLIQTVNTTTFAVGYRMGDMVRALETVLNAVAKDQYSIVSVGSQEHFTLRDVILQENATLATVKLARVDFVLESMNPFQIQKVILSKDETYDNSQNIAPVDALNGDTLLFEIQNPLHLFYPYQTSDNQMVITDTDVALARDKIADLSGAIVGGTSSGSTGTARGT